MAKTVICPFRDKPCTIYIEKTNEKCYSDSLIGKKEGIAGQIGYNEESS